MKLLLAILLAVVVVAGLVTLVFGAQFSRKIARLETRLAETAPAGSRGDLPGVVRAFGLRGMLGAAPAGHCRLTQAAQMRLRKGADWSPLPARQVIAAGASGFTWVAAQKLGPLAIMRVIDSYVAGAGLLEVRLLGAFRIGRADGPEAALGEALRYLAELPWCPDAILTNPEITWAESAGGLTAALDTPGGEARISFSLDPAGDITGIRATRPATLPDGSAALLDWQGTLSDYAEIGGRRIPTRGEVGYHYPDGYEAYWRGRITGYSVAASAAN